MKKVKTIIWTTAMMLLMMPFHAYGQTTKVGDINGDGNVTVSDVLALVQITLNNEGDENQPTAEAGEAIDLGLPSGIKWASCNVGATKPEEYGGYYAWGETEEKEVYYWSTYQWCNGSSNTMTKYCSSSSYGTVDNKTVLDQEDDEPHVKWGGNWRMPTYEEMGELIGNCTTEWTTLNGVNGRKFTSNINGNSIFFPAAGYRGGSSLSGAGSYGYIWPGTQYASSGYSAYSLGFSSSTVSGYYGSRASGLPVRPVMESSNQSGIDKAICDINGDGNVTVSDVLALVQIILNDEEQEEPSVITGEAIDLGLPSGIKWASCNVGATKPEEYGGYYAWGETEEKEVYDWSTYIHCDGSSSTCHDLGSNISGTQYDVAHVKWGGNWRMPTYDEIGELIDNCTTEWTTLNGVYGRKFTSNINGNSIFVPAAGYRGGSSLYYAGFHGYYWSGTQSASTSHYAYYLSVGSGYVGRNNNDRYSGRTVRPVTE
ncbi:MAG: hypothetical protein J5867_08690 [Prevotella sp.]|nr:hypothetical protein [Prevotella sp.]